MAFRKYTGRSSGSGEDEAEKKKPDIMECADRKLSRRSMTAWELSRFLTEKDYPKDEIKELVEKYKALGYLDDRRFCMEYFDRAFARNKSIRRAYAELEEKGVDRNDIDIAFGDYEEIYHPVDDRKMAEAETVRVLRTAGLDPGEPVPDRIKGRAARKLYSYGYRESMIYDILDEIDMLNRARTEEK
ncbi:MAG: regulatory protein RecX [Anaerovoracaceae bacterium]